VYFILRILLRLTSKIQVSFGNKAPDITGLTQPSQKYISSLTQDVEVGGESWRVLALSSRNPDAGEHRYE
jgi:hypothetical protein